MVSRIMKRASESAEKRADDNETTIKNRIETFIKNTDDILNQYPKQTNRVNCFSIFSVKILNHRILDTNFLHFHRLMANVALMPFLTMFLKRFRMFWPTRNNTKKNIIISITL